MSSAITVPIHASAAADEIQNTTDLRPATHPTTRNQPSCTIKNVDAVSSSLSRTKDTQDSSKSPDSSEGNDAGAAKNLSATTIALTMISLCLSVTLSALDMTIVTTAVPAIVASIHSAAGYVWIGSAFILGFTAVTPIWGSVADLWGRKPIILTALTIFLAGSLLCALAPNTDALIAGRAVQGIGASGMGVMVNTIICDMFSLRDRGLYLAITSIIWAIGSAVGPIIGGVFATKLNWQWCFWINLPIGAVVFVVLLFFLKLPSPNASVLDGLKAIDWIGSGLCLGGTVMILLGLDFGDVILPWSSATIINLIIFGTVVIGIFIVNEWKFAANPVIPLRLLSSWSKAATYGVFAQLSVLGVDALTSGLYLLPLVVSCSLSAACAGVSIQRTGKYRAPMYVVQVLLTLGVGLFIYVEFEQDLTKLFIFEVLTGVGVGLNIEAPIIAAHASTTVRDTAAVIATMGFLRSIATAISVVVGGLASQFDGENAAANVESIATLANYQQIVYVAFAGLASFLNLFVKIHHLSSVREDPVLGVKRDKSHWTKMEGQVIKKSSELIDR
ncbi:major facilitator superfamily domain-containing protein [Xylaria telfairii]|nr:major facilitator superfamily domain-containing protein [Xylaria telfairii]